MFLQEELEDILSEETRLRVRFDRAHNWSARLCESETRPQRFIEGGEVLEMPLWLGSAMQLAGVATLLPPVRLFGQRIRADLGAGADQIVMRDICTHWQRVGLKLCALQPREGIADVLHRALALRLPLLLRLIAAATHSQHLTIDPHETVFGSVLPQNILDRTEFLIYTSSVLARNNHHSWLCRDDLLMKPHPMYIKEQ